MPFDGSRVEHQVGFFIFGFVLLLSICFILFYVFSNICYLSLFFIFFEILLLDAFNQVVESRLYYIFISLVPIFH